MADESKSNNLTAHDMLTKLEDLYKKKDSIERQVEKLYIVYEQITEDIELMQTMMMYKNNKKERGKEFVSK